MYVCVYIYIYIYAALLMKLKARECKLNFLMYVIQLSCEIVQLEFPGLAASGANFALVEYGVSKHNS